MITLRLVNRLVKDIDPFYLKIKLDRNDAVDIWLERFKFELESGAMLKKEHIFMSQSPLTIEQMISQINNTLDVISSYDFVANQHPEYPVTEQPQITERLSLEDFVDGPNNAKMNLVHNYFPTLAGPAHRTSNYMYAASPKIRIKICRLNLEVHELHTLLQKNHNHSGIHLNISWQRAPNKLSTLSTYFDNIFTKFVNFGDVLLGYPQVGKTHFEAFIEEDDELDSEHVEPIKLLSGDMLLHLSSDISHGVIDRFDRWLIEKNLDPTDKSLRLGFARLGKVIDIDKEIVKNKLINYNDIDQIIVNDKIFDFPYSRFDNDYDDVWLRHVDD